MEPGRAGARRTLRYYRRQMIHFAGALSCANEFMSPSPFQLQGQGLSNCQHQPAGGIDLEAGKLWEIFTKLRFPPRERTDTFLPRVLSTLQILTDFYVHVWKAAVSRHGNVTKNGL